MGRLTKDPDTKYSTGDKPMAISRFSIAVNRYAKREGEAEADFFNCVSFGKQGEFVEKYLRKGTKVVIQGRLQNNNYTNKNGEKVYSNDIVVERIEFAESKSSSSGNQSQPSTPAAPATPVAQSPADDFMAIPEGIDGDLPWN